MMSALLRSTFVQQLTRSSAAAAATAAVQRLPPALAPVRGRLLPYSKNNTSRYMTSSVVSDFSVGNGGAAPEGDAFDIPVFTSFNVYKAKGALNAKPIKPRWNRTEKGGYKMEKEGGLMFELAQAVGERRYDWEHKVMVFLKPEELATIMAEPNAGHEFYHDTFKGVPGKEGSLVKTLKWSPSPDGKVYFVNASCNNKGENINTNASVSLNHAEFYLLQKLVDSSIAYMYGWDMFFAPLQQ